jgi:sulfate permease, SulP family
VLRPLSDEHPDDETFDGLLILRPEGRLFFLNPNFDDRLNVTPRPH